MGEMTLRQIRLAKEITQADMASLLDVHVNTYIKWEKEPDKISIGEAVRICEVLKVNPDFIIFLPTNSTKM